MMRFVMRSPIYEFDYPFDKLSLLSDYKRRYKTGFRYLAGKDYEDINVTEDQANYSKTTVVRIKNGYAHRVAEEFVKWAGGDEFICHYIGYGKDDFVEWHVDKRPEEYCVNASRVNIFLTGRSYTTFREGDQWYENAVVNVMGAEHKYDNRGLGERVMFQIAIKGISHDELCRNILSKQLERSKVSV